jgi:hypothetical protein
MYVAPISVGSESYNLGLLFEEKESKYAAVPSWLFTSLTDTDH